MASISIVGGFKTGTHTLAKFIKFNIKNNVTYINRYHDIIRGSSESPDEIILSFRNNDEVFPSAFFQDILDNTDSYKYSPFNNTFLEKYKNENTESRMQIILETDPKELYEYYKTIDWSLYGVLHMEKQMERVNNYFNIKIDENDMGVQTFDVIDPETKKHIHLIVVRTEEFGIPYFKKIMAKSITLKDPKDFSMIDSENIGENKWYQNIYRKFKKYESQK